MIDFKVVSETYRKQIFEGFSGLQQREEFVDVTLAADGHLVKAHQNVLAICSPYFRHLLSSVPCPHPVIFLSNLSHKILSFILQYVYSGEVQVPKDLYPAFVEAAKQMHISSLKHLNVPKVKEDSYTTPDMQISKQSKSISEPLINCESNVIHETCTSKVIEIDCGNILNNNLSRKYPQNEIDCFIIENTECENTQDDSTTCLTNRETMECEIIQDHHVKECSQTHYEKFTQENTEGESLHSDNYSLNNLREMELEANLPFAVSPLLNLPKLVKKGNRDQNSIDIPLSTNANYSMYDHMSIPEDDITNFDKIEDENISNEIQTFPITLSTDDSLNQPAFSCNNTQWQTEIKLERSSEQVSAPLYTTSNRGSLQLILNRFVYNIHHQSHGGQKRRWRCVDYRKMQCQAFIDTQNDKIVSRKYEHSHGFHDTRILNISKRKNFFTSVKDVTK